MFTPEILRFFEREQVYHIECNGEAMIIFKALKIAKTEDVKEMLRFSEELVSVINQSQLIFS